jgi:hypothetical protein
MKRVILSGVVVFLILAVLAACGGNNSSTTTTKVTLAVSPTSASVTTGLTQQFTITVTNTTNTAVTWSVNGVVGGTQTVGFISSAGLFTAPSNVPAPATVTVTAVSQADTTVTVSVQVTIVAPATPAAPLVVSPQTVTVPAGGQQTFSATVSGNPIPVNWALNCQASADACGTITTAGVYTAPASPPPGGNVSLTAAAKDNSVPAAGAVITVQYSNGTLNGQYAFTFSGQNAGASYVAAGSISFDGNGNITGGTQDINSGGASAVTITSGTYHIGTDGRGNAMVVTSGGTVNWQFAVVNHARAFVERFDSGVPSASGTMELQDATQFTLAGFTGSYAFNLSGANGTNRPGSLAMAGAMTSSGAGIISGGALDVNSAGSPSAGLSLAGAYAAPNASGRGTMTLSSAFGTQNLAYYVVDATHLKVIETDAGAQLVGDVYKQPAGTFTNASIRGGFVFALLGSTSAGIFGEGGVLTLDGTGNVISATSTIDINKNGNPQNSLAVSGTYNVADATTGRTTATLTVGGLAYQYVFYPQINGALSMVEIDTSNVVAGRALAQSLGSFSSGSFQGIYAFNFTGNDFVVNPGEEDLVGQMVPNGGSALNTSSVDISDNGVLVHSAALSGSYLVSSSGRGSATLATNSTAFSAATMNVYVADSGNALFLESDGTRVLVGIAQKQY